MLERERETDRERHRFRASSQLIIQAVFTLYHKQLYLADAQSSLLRARARQRERPDTWCPPGQAYCPLIIKSVFKVFVSWEGLCRLSHKCDPCTIKGKKQKSAYCDVRMLTVSQHTFSTLPRMLTLSAYCQHTVSTRQHTASTRQHTASTRQHVFPFSCRTSAQYKEKQQKPDGM